MSAWSAGRIFQKQRPDSCVLMSLSPNPHINSNPESVPLTYHANISPSFYLTIIRSSGSNRRGSASLKLSSERERERRGDGGNDIRSKMGRKTHRLKREEVLLSPLLKIYKVQ